MMDRAETMERKVRSIIVGGMLALGLTAFSGAEVSARDTVKIGAILSLTGPAAPFGIPERDTIDLLVKRHNATASGDSRLYEIVYYDDQTNPTEAARGAAKLIEQDQVQAIIGASTGSATLALMPIAAKAQVPVVAPISTPGVVSKERDFFPWIFRGSPSESTMLRFTMDKGVFGPGRKRLAIFFQEDAFGKLAAEVATKLATDRNVEVVASTSAPVGAVDVNAAALRIRGSNPDVILLQASAPAVGAAFVRSLRQLGNNAPIIGPAALAQKPFIDAIGANSEGIQMTSIGNWDDPTAKQKELESLIVEAGRKPSGFGELLGSTAFLILSEGIHNVKGSMSGSNIRNELERICNFSGTFMKAPVCFTADNHDGLPPEVLSTLVVKNGKFVTVD